MLEQCPGEFVMSCGGCDDVQGVASRCGFADGSERANLIFLRKLLRGFIGDIINTGELDDAGFGEFGVNSRVFFAERTSAQNGDTNFGI